MQETNAFSRFRVILGAIALLFCISCFFVAVGFIGNSETRFAERTITNRQDALSTARAFIVALRLNDERAYQMAEPGLHSRLDNWMSTHPKAPKCAFYDSGSIRTSGTGIENQFNLVFNCNIANNGRYQLRVLSIVLVQGEDGEWMVEDYSIPQESIN